MLDKVHRVVSAATTRLLVSTSDVTPSRQCTMLPSALISKLAKSNDMKQRIIYFIGVVLAIASLSSCKKNFLERPPLSSITDANFYKTDEQVMAGTAPLYNVVWFDYND